MNDFFIKKADEDILKNLKNIGFDSSYINIAEKKYKGTAYKIFNLKPYEANILKQISLSLGFDCAISRDSITCKCDKTDCLIFASVSQYEKLVIKLKKQPFRLKLLAEKFNDILNFKYTPLIIGKYTFNWDRPYIMGILNVTPDSFSDGGQFFDTNKAFEHCLKLIDDGADIIDIGGESTRPNAKPITIEEEMKRVIPLIEKIRKNSIDIPISIDSRNFETVKSAVNAGCDIINDVSFLEYDNNLFDYITKNNIPLILMHSNKVPAISSDYIQGDAVDEIYKAFEKKLEKLENEGLERNKIIIDPGIGFGKSKETCFEILKRIDEFTSLRVPLLIGISRKSFMKNLNLGKDDLDLKTALYSAMINKVNIHRVHNVKLTKQFLGYAELLK